MQLLWISIRSNFVGGKSHGTMEHPFLKTNMELNSPGHPIFPQQPKIQQRTTKQRPPLWIWNANLGYFQSLDIRPGQIITTSAEVTLNGGLVRESPQNPVKSGLGIILICPDSFKIFQKGRC